MDVEDEVNSKPTGNVASDRHEGGDRLLHDSKLRVYLCELCDSRATSIKTLREHYQRKHVHVESTPRTPQSTTCQSKKKHACPHCDYRSNLIGHVKRHILIHTGETPFECTHCDYKCRDKSTLRRHIERHVRGESKSIKYSNKDKTYLCKNCSFTTSCKGALSRHLLRHEDPIICQHCSAKFWKEGSYKNHILLHAGIASYPCKSCDYKTNVAGDLTNHVRRMHSKKSWICSECNYSTSCASDLSKHKIIHKSDRPYACNQCEYRGKRRSHLTVHLASHNRILKNYTCPFCDFRAVMIATLKSHVRSHTGEKPYKCDVCGSAYTSRAGVQVHAYTHIKDWSQSCPHCDFKARKPQLFRKHLKTHTRTPGTLPIENRDANSSSRSTTTPKFKETKNLKCNTKVALETKSTPNVDSKVSDPLYEKPPLGPPSSPPLSLPNDDQVLLFNDCKADPDEIFMKPETEFIVPTHMDLDEPVKREDIDIFYPVKQECETPLSQRELSG